MFKIEQGIPIPPRKRGRPVRYAWAELRPGDSFFVSFDNDDKHAVYHRTASAVSHRNRIQAERTFTTRLVVVQDGKEREPKRIADADGIRVWRVK
jgi:hypothetical protein